MKKLSLNHTRFCEEYLAENCNATQAYMKVYGCEIESARRASSLLLKREDITDYIAQLQAELSEKTGITAKWVMENLKEIAERCMQKIPVTDKDGNIIEYKFDSAGANKANELMGKNIGMFKDKSEVELKVTKKLEDFFT